MLIKNIGCLCSCYFPSRWSRFFCLFFSTDFILQVFLAICRFWQNWKESCQKLWDDLVLFQCFGGFWFAIPLSHVSGFFSPFSPVCKWLDLFLHSNVWICLEKMFRTHFWDALTFLRRLKAIGLCNILVRYNETTAFCVMWIVCCDISQLWDVKHVTSYFWWSWYSMLCVFVRRRMGIPETFVTKQWWSVNWCTADHTYHTFSCRRCLYCHADCFAYQF